MRSRWSAILLASIGIASSAHAFQNARFLHGSGSQLQDAIDAAADGDTLLLRGHYGPTRIDGKSITLVSEGNWWVSMDSLTITNIRADQHVTVSGLTTDPVTYTGSLPPGILIDRCAGDVRLIGMNCHVFAPSSHPVMTVKESSNVVLIGMDLYAQEYAWTPTITSPPQAGGEALRVIRSRIAMYRCSLDGGAGTNGCVLDACGTPITFAAAPPAPGISLDSTSTLIAHGSHIRGGRAGLGTPARCDCVSAQLIPATDGLAGGPAIQNEAGSSVVLSGCTVAAGAGGGGGTGATCASSSGTGAGVAGPDGPLSTHATQVLGTSGLISLTGLRTVRAGQSITLNVQGQAGTQVLLGLSSDTRFLPLAPEQGVLVLGSTGRRGTIGVLPPSPPGFMSFEIPRFHSLLEN